MRRFHICLSVNNIDGSSNPTTIMTRGVTSRSNAESASEHHPLIAFSSYSSIFGVNHRSNERLANTFTARDYDWLLDSPIVMGQLTTAPFDVLGARHEWVQFGDAGDWNTGALLPKLERITTEVCSTFGAVPNWMTGAKSAIGSNRSFRYRLGAVEKLPAKTPSV